MFGWTPSHYEWIAIILLIVSLIIVLLEYIWLSVLARRQESHVEKRNQAVERIDQGLETVLYAPTPAAMENEIDALKSFIGDDSVKMDILSTRLLSLLLSEQVDEQQKASLAAVNHAIRPLDFYIHLLHHGNNYQKAYACRKIAIYYAEDELPAVRRLARSKNRLVAYNAAMALAVFGDEVTLARIIVDCEGNYHYSHRIILELLSVYSGDLPALAQRIFPDCDEYIKATVIKGLSDYRLTEFEPIYLEGLKSQNANLRTACVRALGEIGKPEYEHMLITAAHDKNWVVRSTAVKELGQLETDKAKQALVNATSDSEWWVRYNAAKTLVETDTDLTYVEKVLEGYDKYGADAVKYMLYRHYALNGKT